MVISMSKYGLKNGVESVMNTTKILDSGGENEDSFLKK
jgi:hypothetical protein